MFGVCQAAPEGGVTFDAGFPISDASAPPPDASGTD
jgi:hypothetical protein